MERREFYFLYANLNSIAELALRQATAEALAHSGEASAPSADEELTPDERDARVLAGFENLDFSALDGLDLSHVTPEPFDAQALPMKYPDGGEVFSIESYLERAYSSEHSLQERVAHHYHHADIPALNATLLNLPEGLPPLTRPLSATDMTEWLTVYASGSELLTDLIATIRRLDAPA